MTNDQIVGWDERSEPHQNTHNDRFAFSVIPAKAGTQASRVHGWVPAFAGMTGFRWLNCYETRSSN